MSKIDHEIVLKTAPLLEIKGGEGLKLCTKKKGEKPGSNSSHQRDETDKGLSLGYR